MSTQNNPLALTINQKNVLTMIFAVLALCDIRTAITALIEGIAATVEDLRSVSNTISEVAKKKSSATVGTVDSRDEAEDALLDVLMQVARAILAYASKNMLTTVKEIVNVKRWQLAKLPDVELRVKVDAIIELADKYSANIASSGATAQKIAALKAAYAVYLKAAAAVPTGKSTRTGSVDNLKSLFLKANTILREQLDPMVDNLQTDQPVFYKEYRAARVIHDFGGSQPEITPPAPNTPTAPTTPAK